MIFCPLIHFAKSVPSEEDIIDGAANVTTWVTTYMVTAWDYELGVFDGRSRLLWNGAGVLQIISRVLNENSIGQGIVCSILRDNQQ